MSDGATGLRFLVAAFFFALLLALVGNWLASRILDRELNLGVAIVTAVVVGLFVALILMRPRTPHAEGFVVEDARAPELVEKAKKRERELTGSDEEH